MKKTVCKEHAASRPEVESIKKMVRLLEWKRRSFMETDYRKHAYPLQKSQFNQLMAVRFVMPCNLGRIMDVTGLTPPGASLFVNKLVNMGFLERHDDPEDRRNVCISLTGKGQSFLRQVDDRLSEYTMHYLGTCNDAELRIIAEASEIICRKLQG